MLPLPGYGFARAQVTLTNPSDGTVNNNTLNIETPVVEQLAVNLSMSVSDGGAPFVAQKDASPSSGAGGTWTVTVRNTGTKASSSATQVQFNAAVDGNVYGYLQTSGGSGWTCDNNGYGYDVTCTNTAVVRAGGSLPPLAFPYAPLPGYGFARAQVTLTNPSDGTVNNNTLNIETPVVEPTSTIDVVATLSDGGFPFTAGQRAVYYVTVRNVGSSAASGDVTVHYPVPFDGMTASGTGWSCTASTVSDPTCTHSGGLAAGTILPPVTLTGTVPATYPLGTVQAQVSVDNRSDAFTNDNSSYLDTGITGFLPIKVIHGPACPDVMVIAARGSGDPPSDWTNLPGYTKAANDYGAGKPAYTLYTQLEAARPVRFSLAPVVYPADNVTLLAKSPSLYLMDAQLGASNIVADIEHTDAFCSRPVRYILAGYSLGAWTVHVATHELNSTQRGEIAGVALFGDAKFIPLQKIVRDFKIADAYFGLAALTVDRGYNGVPSALVPKTGSWCFPDDPVCQVLPTPVTWLAELALCAKQLCAHFDYPRQGNRQSRQVPGPILAVD